MAISQARKARLAASVVRQGIPVAVEVAGPPKGEAARALEAYERAWARLSGEVLIVLESWIVSGPPGIPLAPRSEHALVVNGRRETVVGTLVHTGIDWSIFDEDVREDARTAWTARAFHVALSTDKELYKLFWPSRGGCRAEFVDADGVVTNLGAMRDALRALPKKAERTAEEAALARQIETDILDAERAHEAPLMEARNRAVRHGLQIESAYADPAVCPFCSGTSIVRPSFDAPDSLMREWRDAAGRASNARFARTEAMRREALHHNEGMFDDAGNRVESWGEFRARVMRPFMTGSGTKGPTTKAYVPGAGAKAFAKLA